MKNIQKIGILFNVLEKADKLIAGVRLRYPNAIIVAVLPMHAHPAAQELAQVDEMVRIQLSPIRLLLSGSFLRVVRQLHGMQFDLLILRFYSLKLRLLAALIAPKTCEAWLIPGTLFPVVPGILKTIKTAVGERMAGIKICFLSWVNTHFVRVKRK